MNAKEYWSTLAKEIGLPEDKVKIIDEVFSNEKVLNGFVPRPEYSRTLNEKDTALKTTQDALQKYQSEVTEYYKTEAQKAAERQQAFDNERAIRQRYEATFGPLEGEAAIVKSPTAPDTLTKKEFEELMKQRDQQTVTLSKQVGRITAEHVRRFNETPDFDAIEKIAVEKGLSAEAAYKDWVAPRIEAQTTASWEEKIKKAREEGAAEARSRANVPIDTQPRETSPFLSNVYAKPPQQGGSAQPLSVSERLANFAAEYSKQTSTSK